LLVAVIAKFLQQLIVGAPAARERGPKSVTEGTFVDIVAAGFDAGVRLGEAVPQDMVAVAFGGEGHIRFRLPSGKMYRWEFSRRGEEFRLDVTGAITLDHMGLMIEAAIKGLGIAYVSAWTVKPLLPMASSSRC
jgi:DNA-binding transcriptional LysR family regulator